MRHTGGSSKLFESNSDSEGQELFKPRKPLNEPPSPDLKRRSRPRVSSRDAGRASTKGDDMKTVSTNDKENVRAQQLEERKRWERPGKMPSRSIEDHVPRRTHGHAPTLDTFSSADNDVMMGGHRLRLPGSVAGDSGRHSSGVIKQEVEETPPKRHDSRLGLRSSSRASPNQPATNSSAAKKLSNFKAAERAGRTICVCGASAYYERERFALLKEKAKLKEDQQGLRDESKRVMENHRKVKEEIFECEKKRNELESCGRSLQRSREMQQEEAAVLEQSRRQLQKLKDQIEKDKDALQRTQQDLILKGEEFAARKSHLERLQQDLKSKKAELEDRSIQIKKQAIKNESVESTLEMESHKLATLQSELALESEQIKLRENSLRENEGRYEEKRRMLQSLESRLNHEVSMNEEKIKYLDGREEELRMKSSELDARETELKNLERDLDRQKQEIAGARTEFEFQRQRELESIENEKKAAAAEIQLNKEDCKAFIDLEKEWISQEKENLIKHKEAVQREIEAEREHMQQMMTQMRKRNHEVIEEEKEEWRREQQRTTECRNRQRLELESMREAISQKEYELLDLKEALASEREQLTQEKAALESFKEHEMKEVQAEKNEVLKLSQQLRKDRQNCNQIEIQLKARFSALDAREDALNTRDKDLQQQWQSLSRMEIQWESRTKELDSKGKRLSALEMDLNAQKESLLEREKRLTNSESQTAWLKEIYAELKEKKEAIVAQEKRLEMEKSALSEQRQLLLKQQQQHSNRCTPSHASSARLQRSTPKRFPGTLCRRYSTSGLPQLQTILPPHSRLASFNATSTGLVINVSSGDEGASTKAVQSQDSSAPQEESVVAMFPSIQPGPSPRQDEVYEHSHHRASSVPTHDQPLESAEWSMFAAFDDSQSGFHDRGPNAACFLLEEPMQENSCRSAVPDSHINARGSSALRVAYEEGASPRDKNADAGLNEADDDISLSSRDHHLLRQFGDPTSFEVLPSETKSPNESYEAKSFDVGFEGDKSSKAVSSRSSANKLSHFVYTRGADITHFDLAESLQCVETPEQSQTQRDDLLSSHRDRLLSTQREEAAWQSDNSALKQDPTSQRSKMSAHYQNLVATALQARENAISERSEREDNSKFEVQLNTSSNGSSPLIMPQGATQDREHTPSQNGSISTLRDPPLSAPTTSPIYTTHTELSLPVGCIDFDTSIGPSISRAVLVNCTDEVRESIEQTIQMTYGSSRNSWQEEQDTYKSIHDSLELLGSSQRGDTIYGDDQKAHLKSLTTSERITTAAHENEGPSNCVWGQV